MFPNLPQKYNFGLLFWRIFFLVFRKDCVNFLYIKNSFKVPQIFKNSKLYRTCVACTRGETWRIFGIELLKIDLIDSYVSVFEISEKVPFHSSLANNADIFLRRIKNKWLNEAKIIFVFFVPGKLSQDLLS